MCCAGQVLEVVAEADEAERALVKQQEGEAAPAGAAAGVVTAASVALLRDRVDELYVAVAAAETAAKQVGRRGAAGAVLLGGERR